jgi:hypothetical protein
VIVVPAFAWKTVIDTFTTALGIAERVAFLDGVAAGPRPADGGVVTTVVFPQARESAGDWEVDPVEMSAAGRHLRPYGLVRLAQVHSHPTTWTGHSPTDDERAFSHQPGTISIVLPGHALTYPGRGDAGVHLRETDGWRELAHDEVGDYVRVVPSVIDHRRWR